MMSFKTTVTAVSAALLMIATPSLAEGIMVKDAYVRSSTPSSPTGAAFMVLMNHGASDDRLISAHSNVSKRVELHRHREDANGIMRMSQIEEGIALPAGEMHKMQRGGDHVMFMGLTAPLVQGTNITVTLMFEQAGAVDVIIPVDHKRKPDHSAHDH